MFTTFKYMCFDCRIVINAVDKLSGINFIRYKIRDRRSNLDVVQETTAPPIRRDAPDTKKVSILLA
jgi:hypothetical protein